MNTFIRNNNSLWLAAGVVVLLTVSGCANIKEFGKTLWGSSTRALEEARENAIGENFPCKPAQCFDDVLTVATEEYKVFLNDPDRQILIVMGIPESISTTEVGIFFVPVDDKTTRVELSSLSSHARGIVADTLFAELSEMYSSSTTPDPEGEDTSPDASL